MFGSAVSRLATTATRSQTVRSASSGYVISGRPASSAVAFGSPMRVACPPATTTPTNAAAPPPGSAGARAGVTGPRGPAPPRGGHGPAREPAPPDREDTRRAVAECALPRDSPARSEPLHPDAD